MTIAEQAAAITQKLVTQCLRQYAPTGVATTFDLYRRTTAGPVSALGVPNDPFAVLLSAVPCVFVAVKLRIEGEFEIRPEGQIRHSVYECYTAETSILAGDNVVIALDGQAYNVERAGRLGSVMALLLDHSAAQVQP